MKCGVAEYRSFSNSNRSQAMSGREGRGTCLTKYHYFNFFRNIEIFRIFENVTDLNNFYIFGMHISSGPISYITRLVYVRFLQLIECLLIKPTGKIVISCCVLLSIIRWKRKVNQTCYIWFCSAWNGHSKSVKIIQIREVSKISKNFNIWEKIKIITLPKIVAWLDRGI